MKKFLDSYAYYICFFIILSIFISAKLFVFSNGNPVYVLDDPYIHLATAKNFAFHGVFGVTQFEFTSSSSSPLWTFLLVLLIKIFGNNASIPYYLNLFFSLLTLTIVFKFFYKSKSFFNGFSILIAFLSAPFLALIHTGLEHTAHIFLTTSFIFLAYKFFSNQNSKLDIVLLLINSLFLSAARYEGAFLIFVCGIIFIYQKKYFLGFSIWILGALAPISMGLYSMQNGWSFLPNSIYLKGNTQIFSSITEFIKRIFYMWYLQIAENPHILVILGINTFILIKNIKEKQNISKIFLSVSYLSASLLHLQLAQTGWFYRYEAYIVFSGIIVILIAGEHIISKYLELVNGLSRIPKAIAIVLILIMVSPLLHRAIESTNRIKPASTNIYEQQISYANFITKFYNQKTIALNDVGAANYFNNIKSIDLWGLSNKIAAKAKKNNDFDSTTIKKLFELSHPDIAIVYPDWYLGKTALPANWIKISEWKIFNNFVCGESRIGFYAPDSSSANNLLKNLKSYESELSSNIVKYYFYK